MAWLTVDNSGAECIYEDEPTRDVELGWYWANGDYVVLPKGSIEKLIGKVLTWEDEPYELK